MRLFAILALLCSIVGAQDGTPQALAYLANNWSIAKLEYEKQADAIEADAAAHGRLCSSGTGIEESKLLLYIVQVFLSSSLDYVKGLASNRYALNKTVLADTLASYKTRPFAEMLISYCGSTYPVNPPDSTQVVLENTNAVLALAPIVPNSCPTATTKAPTAPYRGGRAFDASGRIYFSP